jgi:GNAT superfamily N-acetyltransferase
MTAQVIIRKATQDDIHTLLVFEQGVISSERPYDPTLKNDPLTYYDLDAMINDPEVELVIGEFQGQLIGSGYARIENAKPYLKHEKHAYLGFMYVDPAWRGKGVNQLIVENLKQWAIAKGLTEMRLDVYFANLGAIKAYEKAGFKNHMIEMRMGI